MPSPRRICVLIAATMALASLRPAAAQAPTHLIVHVTDGGTTREISTSATTVEEFLAEQQIALGKLDTLSVARDTTLRSGLKLSITRVRQVIAQENTALPFKKTERLSTGMRVGESKTIRPGVPGVLQTTYRDTYHNEERIERERIDARVLQAPRTAIVVRGLRGMTLASRGLFPGRRSLEMVATGYGPSGNGPWGMQTTLGIRPRHGVVAVDPRVIRLGTRLYIEGYGLAIAADTGSAIRGNRIDLFFESDRVANSYGRKRVRVLILP